jgi:hypothetical protein
MALTLVVDYVAHEGCPERPAFIEYVRRRASFEVGDAGHRVAIRIWRDDGKSHGVLTVGGDARQRTFEAPTCGEVTALLALSLGLLVDAWRDPAPRALPPLEPHDDEPPTPSLPGPSSASVGVSAAEPSSVPAGSRLSFGVLAAFESFGASAPTGGAGTWLHWAPARSPLSVRASVGWLAGSSGGASFFWGLATGEACLRVVGDLGACLGADGGALSASAPGGSALRPWLAPTLAVRWAPMLGRHLTLELRAVGAAPLTRETFLAAPGAPPYFRADALAFGGSVGVGWSFP